MTYILDDKFLYLRLWYLIPSYLPLQSSTTGDSGDVSSSKKQAGVSIGCTAFGLLFVIAGFIAIIVSIVVVTNNAVQSATPTPNRNFG